LSRAIPTGCARSRQNFTNESGRSVETIAVDLTKTKDLADVEAVLKNDASVIMLVNNAGLGATGPLLQSDIGKMEKIDCAERYRHNAARVCGGRAFAKRGEATIINLSSSAAINPELLNGVYGASQAFVLAFSQALHHELADKGIRIQAVLPGAIATDFWTIAGTIGAAAGAHRHVG
jgi:short-subunit dehydrogenase